MRGGRRGARAPDRLLRAGVAGAVLVLVAFGTLYALAVPPFLPVDEAGHVSYALDVAHGRLPRFGEPVHPVIEGMGPGPNRGAMHPPLFYALAAGPLRLALASGHPLAGVIFVRLLNVAFGAVLVVLVARLALAVFPGRPETAVAAAALTALPTSLQETVGFVYNDALALAAGTAVLIGTVEVLRRGWSPRLGVWLAVAILAATATRASGLVLAAVAAVAVAARSPGVVAAARRVAAVLVPAALAVGWFYVRNAQLYGDVAGMGKAASLGPAVAYGQLLVPSFWATELRYFWGHLHGVAPAAGWSLTLVAIALAIVVASALPALVRARRRLDRASVLGVGALVACVLLTAATFARYVHLGGLPTERYLYPAVPAAALLAVGALVVGFGRAGRLAAATVVVLGFAASAAMALREGMLVHGLARTPVRPHLLTLTAHGWPRPLAAAIVLAAIAILGFLAVLAGTLRPSLPRRHALTGSRAPVPVANAKRSA